MGVRRLTGLACVATVCLAALASASASAAGVNNVAATRAYLRADEAYARSGSVLAQAMVGAIAARASEIAAGCPSALTYAPRDEAFERLGEEISMSTWYAYVAPVRAATLRLSEAVARLRWSDRGLTRLVHALAAEESADAALVLPDVCPQIAAWRASAYATLPRQVGEFDRRVYALEAGLTVGPSEESREQVIMRLLRPYERTAERRSAEHIERVETGVDRRLSAATAAATTSLAGALGVAAL